MRVLSSDPDLAPKLIQAAGLELLERFAAIARLSNAFHVRLVEK
jgi:hypothetical protein